MKSELEILISTNSETFLIMNMELSNLNIYNETLFRQIA